MKRYQKLIVATVTCVLLVGCSETPTVYNNSDYRGEPMKVADGIYFKKVFIQGMYALLQCDKDGNITHNQNINTGYQEGKVFTSTSVLTPSSELSDKDSKFNFNCSEINDCYNQVMVVKNSLNK